MLPASTPELLLPRGVWRFERPVHGAWIFLLVTTSGDVMIQRAPVELLATEETATTVVSALERSLYMIDPRPRIVRDATAVHATPSFGRSTLRVLDELGFLDQLSETRPATGVLT